MVKKGFWIDRGVILEDYWGYSVRGRIQQAGCRVTVGGGRHWHRGSDSSQCQIEEGEDVCGISAEMLKAGGTAVAKW